VRDALNAVGALEPGVTCLVAVSGGRDSMVLLDICREIGRTEGRFVAGTVDHGLRPFRAEAGLVERFCAARDIPWRLISLDPGLRERAREEGRSLEDRARRERYAALDALADTLAASRILTAHTLDDQAETVLLRLLRGAGPGGLAGIRAALSQRILRPLLAVTRDAVAGHAETRRLPWVRDPGNEDEALRRVRLRALLSDLDAAAPGAAGVLARNADVAADQAAGLRAWALEHFGLTEDASLPLDLPLDLVGTGPAARVRLHALLRALGLADRLERSHLEIMEDLAAGPEGRRADLPGDLEAARRGDRLHLGPAEPPPRADAVEITGPGCCDTPLGVLDAAESEPGEPLADQRVEAQFDAASVRWPLRLRSPRRGERIRPFGLSGHTRLISDLLSEARVPRALRRVPRVLEDADGQVLWLVGCRRSSAATVGADTTSVLRLRLAGSVLDTGAAGCDHGAVVTEDGPERV